MPLVRPPVMPTLTMPAMQRLTPHRTTLKHIHYESSGFYTCLPGALTYLFIHSGLFIPYRVLVDVMMCVNDCAFIHHTPHSPIVTDFYK